MNSKINDRYTTLIGAGFRFKTVRQGNFTVAAMLDEKGHFVTAGVARRNPAKDGDDPLLGQDTAVRRAIKSLFPKQTGEQHGIR